MDIETWVERVKDGSGFGIELPTGWVGRPHDNVHLIEKFEKIGNSDFLLQYDQKREFRIHGCKKVWCEVEFEGCCLAIFEFKRMEWITWSYGEERTEDNETDVYHDGRLVLHGYNVTM